MGPQNLRRSHKFLCQPPDGIVLTLLTGLPVQILIIRIMPGHLRYHEPNAGLNVLRTKPANKIPHPVNIPLAEPAGVISNHVTEPLQCLWPMTYFWTHFLNRNLHDVDETVTHQRT